MEKIKPHANRLAKICSEIRDSELPLIVKAVCDYVDTAELDKKSYFYRFAEAINVKYDVPMDLRMIEHAVLLEAARRYADKEN
jgi:hypothetical protein